MEETTLSGLPHPNAFNPALIHWRGRILIMYRTGLLISELYLGEVDRDFKPMGKFHQVTFPGAIGCEDARFFIHRDRLYFSFVVCAGDYQYRTGIGLVNDNLTVSDCRVIEGTDPVMNEKNWIFFSHENQLYLTYAMSDGVHQVYRLRGNRCEPIYRTHYENPWKWGIARGGTQLIQHQGLWYGFFHGTDYESEGVERRYFMGAYAVSPEPPFPIVRMSGAPLYTPSETFYRPPDRSPTGRVVAVVFPSGLILEDGNWLVYAGYNDHAMRLFKIGHAELESNLISTVSKKQPEDISQRGRFTRVHWFPLDHFWTQPVEFVKEHREEGEAVFANERLQERIPEIQTYGNITSERLREGTNWMILHKGSVDSIVLAALDELNRAYTVVFANEVFVVFTNKVLLGLEPNFDPEHVAALWTKVENRKSGKTGQKTVRQNEVGARLYRFWLSFYKLLSGRLFRLL